MGPVRAQLTTEGEEEAEEAWQNAALVPSEDSLAVGPEHSEDTTAEESEMENSGSPLTRVLSKSIAVPWDMDHEAPPALAKRLKRDDDRGHEDRNCRSDRGQDDSHRERHSYKLSSSSRSSKGSSTGLSTSWRAEIPLNPKLTLLLESVLPGTGLMRMKVQLESAHHGAGVGLLRVRVQLEPAPHRAGLPRTVQLDRF